MKINLPVSFFGLTFKQILFISSILIPGPILIPIGLSNLETKSKCSPSINLVLSPTHTI